MMQISRRAFVSGAGLAIGGPLVGRSGAFAVEQRANLIEVTARPGETVGTLRFGRFATACALGRSGILSPKQEGDGGTPAGRFPLREVRYRPDRLTAPESLLPILASKEADGWCDEPSDPSYNRLVSLPYASDAEQMWRDDHLYDVLAVIGYNDDPVVPKAGSAIFMHIALEEAGKLMPTAGCVSLRRQDLLTVLAACFTGTMIDIRLV